MTAELATKTDILAAKPELLAVLKQEIAAVKQDAGIRKDIAAVEERSRLAMENLSLRLTVRLGILLAAGIAALGVVVRLGH